jgi:hypothetical protein
MADNNRLPNPWATPLITVPVAGELLGMTRAAAYDAAGRGELPTITLAGGKRVPVAALYELLGLPLPGRSAAPIIDR